MLLLNFVYFYQVHWKAKLKQNECKYKWNGKLFMKLESIMNDNMDDEKKSDLDIVNSSLIPFDINKEEYDYKFNNLQKNKMYRLRLYFYEKLGNENNNKNMKRIDILDEYIISFKTLNLDFNDRQFRYKSDYDENGICYFIGTNYGISNKWTNPAETKKIKLRSSEWSKYTGSINDMVGRTASDSRSVNDLENAWVIIDFGSKIKIKPRHYTLRHFTSDGWYLKSWNLLGSIDGNNWTIIDKHSHWISPFPGSGKPKTFKIENCQNYYQMFKIQMTAKNSRGNWLLCCNCFEVYGYMTGNK